MPRLHLIAEDDLHFTGILPVAIRIELWLQDVLDRIPELCAVGTDVIHLAEVSVVWQRI